MSVLIKLKSILLSIVILISLVFNQNYYAKTNIVGNFPNNYLSALNNLSAEYPNWKFVADFVPLTFYESLSMQDDLFVKVTDEQYNSWRSMRKGCYDWNNNKFNPTGDGTFYGASREVIAYHLDPRNFLNKENIFMFLDQSFKTSVTTITDVDDFLKDTFLDTTISDTKDNYFGKRYSEVIFDVATQTNINPLIIAAIILNENGNNGSDLTNGIQVKNTIVYNFFNFSAFGKSLTEVLLNSANFAYSQGWTSPSKAIINGTYKYFNDQSHLDINTCYYQNFNVFVKDGRVFQYSPNVEETVNFSNILNRFYQTKSNLSLVFHIPVFSGMPSSASPLPGKSTKLNNYYIDNLEGYMLTPSFNRYNYEYSMVSRGEEKVYIDLPKGATLVGSSTYNLTRGSNIIKLTVKAQSGHTNEYKLNILAYKNGTLTIVNGTQNKIILGDTNSDKKVTILDLANIRLHLLNQYTLKNANFTCADTNCDGAITTTDLENVRLHLLKIISLN